MSTADREIIDGLSGTGLQRKKSEEQLFSRYDYFIKEGIYKYALREDQAFDAYSDTILSAIDKISAKVFEGRSSLKTWLYQIFHNKCVDLVRKSTTNKSNVHRTLSITELLFQISDSTRTIIQELIEKTDREFMRQKLNLLGDNCREMLLKWADGISDKEIAIALQYKTAEVAKTSRLRCLEKLKQLYKPKEQNGR